MAEPTPRVKLPRSIEPGVPFTVKTRITHPMHTGERHDSEGALVPALTLVKSTATPNGVLMSIYRRRPAPTP